MKKYYRIDNKEFFEKSDFLKYLYSRPYKEMKTKEIEIKCNIEDFIGDSQKYFNEQVKEIILENSDEVIKKICEAFE